MNIYACYKNVEGKWVVDGNKGRDTYPGDWDKENCINHYTDSCDGFHVSLGKYEISVYQHDIAYKPKGNNAALVVIDEFKGDEPRGRKAFYLPHGKFWNQWCTESDVDRVYARREGSWL